MKKSNIFLIFFSFIFLFKENFCRKQERWCRTIKAAERNGIGSGGIEQKDKKKPDEWNPVHLVCSVTF